jgi:hypothetical protein
MGWLLMAAAGIGLALIVGVTSGTARAASTTSDALLSKLAVLRRPQVASDVLPAGLRISGQQGTIIGRLSRLVAVEPNARLFMVVSTPAGGDPPLWSPKLGDQVAIIAVTSHGAIEDQPVPALDLTDADQVGYVGAPRTGPGYRVAVVPDGVARVRWALASVSGKVQSRVSVAVANNLAVTPLRPRTGLLLQGRWYAADGSRIPTSGRALHQAIAAHDGVLKQRLIRYAARHAHRAAPALLNDFAIFAIHGRTGVSTSAGLTISHPRLSDVPLGILQIASPTQTAHLDLTQIRAIQSRSGSRFWVIPGARGLCLAVLGQSRLPIESFGPGSADDCSPNVASATLHGTGLSSGNPGGITITWGVLPDAHPTTTIRTGPHTHRTIHPPDGVYITRYVPHP